MVEKLFDYDDVESKTFWSLLFYGVTLIQAVGPHPVGTKFDSAYVDFESGILEFYNKGAAEFISSHKLFLVVHPG